MISDPLLNEYGPLRPVVLLSKELSRKYSVSVVSLRISESMRKKLGSYGVESIDISSGFFSREQSFMFVEACLKETLFAFNSRKLREIMLKTDDCKLLSFSCTMGIPADLWYGQGLVSTTLSSVVKGMSWYYVLMGIVMKPLAFFIDRKLNISKARASKVVIANSNYCARLYEGVGINVYDVIYEPLDCETYRPVSPNPSSDYVLTYMGKETNFSILRRVADMGVKIKTFGAKLSYAPVYLRHNPNIEFLGRVSEQELIELYSNAYYTLFPFTDEVFGYVPVESMACGTPVLTYACQGPGETVIDGATGWLAHNDDEIVRLAKKLKSDGYPRTMRSQCRRQCLNFDVRHIAKEWMTHIEEVNSNRENSH